MCVLGETPSGLLREGSVAYIESVMLLRRSIVRTLRPQSLVLDCKLLVVGCRKLIGMVAS
jgi:hypothetical protein